MLRTRCKRCGRRVRGGDDWAGRTGNCPHCQYEIAFPGIAPIAPELHPPTSELRGEQPSKVLPVIEHYVELVVFVFLTGGIGYRALEGSIIGWQTGKLPWRAGLSGRIFVKVTEPTAFWALAIYQALFGIGLLLLCVIGLVYFAKRIVAVTPTRYSLRQLLAAVTVVAILTLPVLKFLLATIREPGLVSLIAFGTAFEIYIIITTWRQQQIGFLNFGDQPPIDRRDRPFFFFLWAAVRYLVGLIALMVAAALALLVIL